MKSAQFVMFPLTSVNLFECIETSEVLRGPVSALNPRSIQVQDVLKEVFFHVSQRTKVFLYTRKTADSLSLTVFKK